jgi:hypothetical protein
VPARQATDRAVPKMQQRRMSDEDRARVEQFLNTPVNRVERKPFRPLYLMIMLLAVMAGLMALSRWLASFIGA